MTSEERWFLVGGLVFACLEAYLGRTPRLKAGSTLELIWNILHGAYEIGRRLARRGARPEGERRMSIEKREVTTSESAEKLTKFVEELVCDIIDRKDKKEILGDLTEAIELLPEMKELADDYKANPEAVERAILIGGHAFARRLVASLKARGDASAVPGK